MALHQDDIRRRAEARVGGVLRGKYRLDRLLGLGGMACVYAATHRNNKSRVAIKMLHAELSVNSDIRARFLREGYVANTVEHPGVVRVLDDDVTEDGAVFLVMDLLDGETVGARCARLGGKLPAGEVMAIVLPLLDVLAAAHEKDIVHRDIKPENVFVTRALAVKILDFGIARLREGAGTSTLTGQTVGTPAFMAPEQALGRTDEIGPYTDVWAVGATMFALLAGQLPHPARTDNEMLVFAATKPMRPLSSVAPDVPPELARIVDKAVAFDRDARYGDARAMKVELEGAMRALAPDGYTLSPPPTLAEQVALSGIDERSAADGLASTKASTTPAIGSADALAPTLASDAAGAPRGPTTTAASASVRRPSAPGRSGSRKLTIGIAFATVGLGAAIAATIALRGGGTAPKQVEPHTAPSAAAAPVVPAASSLAPESISTVAPTPTTTATITTPKSAMPKATIAKPTKPTPTSSTPLPTPTSTPTSTPTTTPTFNPLDHQ